MDGKLDWYVVEVKTVQVDTFKILSSTTQAKPVIDTKKLMSLQNNDSAKKTKSRKVKAEKNQG